MKRLRRRLWQLPARCHQLKWKHESGWNPFRTSLSSPKLPASEEIASPLQNTTNTPPPSVSRYDLIQEAGKGETETEIAKSLRK